MPENIPQKTVLVLAPHPDDAEFYAGGTIAKMAEDGARVFIAIATDGRKGSFELDANTLVRERAAEARAAAQVLGAEPPILLGHADMGLDLLSPGVLRQEFIHLIRQIRPEVVITEDPYQLSEPHPDHRAVAWAASDAIHFASLPLMHPEQVADGFQPHFVIEKYYYRESAEGANKIVDISSTLQKRIAALLEHKSQVKFLVDDVLSQARLAGLDPKALLGEAATDPSAAIAWFIENNAAVIGQSAGVPYGEAFRYERFHPLIEGFLSNP